jgi:hypothetical protein
MHSIKSRRKNKMKKIKIEVFKLELRKIHLLEAANSFIKDRYLK